jgi:hypothetical protein
MQRAESANIPSRAMWGLGVLMHARINQRHREFQLLIEPARALYSAHHSHPVRHTHRRTVRSQTQVRRGTKLIGSTNVMFSGDTDHPQNEH